MPTPIAWTDETWNPVTGCRRVSRGCDNCYAVAMTRRLAGMGQEKYRGLVGSRHFYGVVKCHYSALEIPLRWRKPRRVLVNSMSDLLYDLVPDSFIKSVLEVMARCPQHTFQILTKRPERMMQIAHNPFGLGESFFGLPLANVWLGTSVEDQPAADERTPHIQRCRAAVRFLSVEPMLGPIQFPSLDGIHWVIFGCESGPKRRPFRHDWVQRGIEQCDEAGVPVFVKQITAPDGRVSTKSEHWPFDLQRQEWPKETP